MNALPVKILKKGKKTDAHHCHRAALSKRSLETDLACSFMISNSNNKVKTQRRNLKKTTWIRT